MADVGISWEEYGELEDKCSGLEREVERLTDLLSDRDQQIEDLQSRNSEAVRVLEHG